MYQNRRLLTIVLFFVIGSGFTQLVHAQSVKKVANNYVEAARAANVDGMIAQYADSVQYDDPIYGTSNVFTKEQIRGFYAPFFAPGNTANLRILTTAIDSKESVFIVHGLTYNTTEKVDLPILVYLKVEKGKIVHQIDFPVYAVESLKASPRYKPFFKD